MLVIAGVRVTPTTARVYFGIQALAGAAWWAAVFSSDAVRQATLGALPVPLVATLDIPLFVVASVVAACGIRVALWVVVPWTAVVAVGMAGYATITGLAG